MKVQIVERDNGHEKCYVPQTSLFGLLWSDMQVDDNTPAVYGFDTLKEAEAFVDRVYFEKEKVVKSYN